MDHLAYFYSIKPTHNSANEQFIILYLSAPLAKGKDFTLKIMHSEINCTEDRKQQGQTGGTSGILFTSSQLMRIKRRQALTQ